MEIPTTKSAVALIDVIYYRNVLETAKKWVDAGHRVLIVMDIYTEKATEAPYSYYDSEGYFTISKDSNS